MENSRDDDRAKRVAAVLHAEWQTVVRARAARRRSVWVTAGGVAGAALVAVVLQTGTLTERRQPSGFQMALAAPTAHEGALFRANGDDRWPHGGLARNVLAGYSREQ